MTIKEIIRRQQMAEGRTLYLIQQGMFYHAFNEAAVFIASATGYKVRIRYFPDGTKYTLSGFPINLIGKVVRSVEDKYNDIEIEVGRITTFHLHNKIT